jgi:hypothetical protein
MTHRDFRASAVRHAVRPALLACVALVACSSTPAPPPEAFVSFTLGPHPDSMGNNLCNNASPVGVLSIGAATGGTPLTQPDGSHGSTGNVAVGCSVKGGFTVVLTAGLGGGQGGSLEIDGSNIDTSSGGSNISATFTSNSLTHSATDCTITYKYQGGPVLAAPPVAPGRIWAHLSCPDMVNPNQQKNVNGMQVSETCDGEADFLFQKCQL